VQIDLMDRRELKLVVRPATNNTFGDHADWAQARLICN